MKGFWMFSVALIFVLAFIILISRRTDNYYKLAIDRRDRFPEEHILYSSKINSKKVENDETVNTPKYFRDTIQKQDPEVLVSQTANIAKNKGETFDKMNNGDKSSPNVEAAMSADYNTKMDGAREKTMSDELDDKETKKNQDINDKNVNNPSNLKPEYENALASDTPSSRSDGDNFEKQVESKSEMIVEYLSEPAIHVQKTFDPKLITHFMPKHADPSRYMIYFCHGGCGGLADRQKGIVGTYLMALLTNRTFGINITSPCAFTRYYKPNLLNWVIDPKQFEGLTVRYHSSLSGFDFLNKIHKTDLNKYYPEDIVYFKGNIDYVTEIRRHPLMSKVIPYMTYLQNPDVYSIILHILLGLAPRVSNQLVAVFDNKVKSKHLVCAHVRLGKNPTMADVSRKLSMEEITELWQFLDKYKQPDKYSIFVAGDSNEVRDIARKRYGSQNIEIPGPIVHIARRNYTTKESSVAELRAIQSEGMKKVVIEQNILQRCDTLILTRSGFNLMAVYQRNHSENLYCLVKNQVLPCVRELVYNLFILF